MMTARTDKEARLKDFIVEGLLRRGDVSDSNAPLMIVVRNNESPVARALCAALSENPEAAVDIKIIFGGASGEEPAAAAPLQDIEGAEFRVIDDPRFAAAHEQMVVGNTHVWIGDCLRRDPTKRDAFELYHRADQSVHLFTAASFVKLWASAKPMKQPKDGAVSPEIIAAGQADSGYSRPRDHRH